MCHLIFFKCKEFRFLKSPNYSSSIVTFADSICLLITLHTVSYLICSNTALNKKSEAKVIEVDTKKVLLKTNFCFMNKSFHRKKKKSRAYIKLLGLQYLEHVSLHFLYKHLWKFSPLSWYSKDRCISNKTLFD